MTTIENIAKNTYKLTFDHDANYEWLNIAEVLIDSENVAEVLTRKGLINQNETEKKLLYWQDLFFMEIAENEREISPRITVKIKNHKLYKANRKFIEQLPKLTTEMGRELLIDSLIENENSDILIPDDILENVLKKKSREDLRQDFEKWNETDKEKSNNKNNFVFVKYLAAACFLGILLTIGYNTMYKNNSVFDNSQFVNTSEKVIIRDNGFGFIERKDESVITVQILNYGKALSGDKALADKLVVNSYSFGHKKLKLVLTDSPTKIELIELEQKEYYLKINNSFYKLEISENFKKLQPFDDQKSIEHLEQILFENE